MRGSDVKEALELEEEDVGPFGKASVPGVLGDHASTAEESFAAGLLEYPQYTRPQAFEGHAIPDVLTSGNHSEISKFRHNQAENLTKARRPDLWALYEKDQKGPRKP